MNENEKRAPDKRSGSAEPLQLLGLTALVAAGGWIVYSASMIDHNLPLPLAIESERRLFTGGSAGLLNYYVDESGGGRPLVLIHSINAAASAYEMRPIFEHYRGRRLVYAIDLPGFGFSERSDRYYSRDLYVGAIRDFLEDVVSEPADVVALSLSSEFSALVAKETPDRIHSLALISPTGLSESEGDTELGENRKTGRSEALLNLFSFPLWSQAFYDLLVTWPSIRYFLGKSFDGAVDEGLADYAYLSSHQPGARYAPLHFVSGQLFTPGILSATYSRLERPALIVYDKDPFTSFESLPDLLLDQPSWSAARITPTSGLPQFEQMDVLAKVLDNYWHSLEK